MLIIVLCSVISLGVIFSLCGYKLPRKLLPRLRQFFSWGQRKTNQRVIMAFDSDVYMKVKDFINKAEDKDARPLPAGAKPTFWMFTLPRTPDNSVDKVYPNLYLGDQSAARNKDMLQSLGITHVVNTAHGTKFNQVDTTAEYYADVGIQFHAIPGMDVSGFKMSSFFPGAADFIDGGLQAGGKVFVHCMMGVSRSATIVIAYLMLKQKMSVLDAVKTVRSKRAICPNDGFVKQLCELQKELDES